MIGKWCIREKGVNWLGFKVGFLGLFENDPKRSLVAEGDRDEVAGF